MSRATRLRTRLDDLSDDEVAAYVASRRRENAEQALLVQKQHRMNEHVRTARFGNGGSVA